MKKILILVLLWTGWCLPLLYAKKTEYFAIQDGDVWVMAGDSITAQGLHSNFIEAFFHTRYPQKRLHFRNSGISGNRVEHLLNRFDYDVAAWKPTIVSMEFGMNDSAGAVPLNNYVEGMEESLRRIQALNARPILISSSPVNDGSIQSGEVTPRNQRIRQWTDALQELGKKHGVEVIDQYAELVDMWGRNWILLQTSETLQRVRQIPDHDPLPRLHELKEFANQWGSDGKKPGYSLGGDPVHPGPLGQYTMAVRILQQLNVDPEVSSVTIHANGQVENTRYCKVSDIETGDGILSFSRLDERLPWPIPPQIIPELLSLIPDAADLSLYMLTVKNLSEGNYMISMDGVDVHAASASQLAQGINLSTVVTGPLIDRGARINRTIGALQATPVRNWRAASQQKDSERLAAATKLIEQQEQQLREEVQPKAIRFQIHRVNQ